MVLQKKPDRPDTPLDVVNMGGESTLTGAAHVSGAQELVRVMPVVEALLKPDTIVSVDASNALVAQETLHTGVHLILSLIHI